MKKISLITVLMFGSMILFLVLGLPLSFSLGGLAAIFSYFFWGPAALYVILANVTDLMRSTLMVAVPLFIFLAFMLQNTGIAEKLFITIYKCLGSLSGGLAIAVVFSCTVIAAMSGISTTGVLLMGIIALPVMEKKGYDAELAMGSILAGGTLGPLIPPSLILILYSLMSGESIGKLFLGGVIPGLILSSFFTLYILIRCYLNPKMGPALNKNELISFIEKLISLKEVILPLLLVLGVLGSIFFGMATPTEAAAVGAFGTLLLALVSGRLNKKTLIDTCVSTLQVTGSVMWVVFSASCFASIYQGLGASKFIKMFLISHNIGQLTILMIMQIIWILLGCMMDTISILMLTGPIFLPIAMDLKFNLVWFGLLYVLNTNIGYLTPPFGVNLVVMKGVVKERYPMKKIINSIWPFIAIQLAVLALVIAFPSLVTWVE